MVRVARLLVREGLSLAGPSELVSGQVGRALDPSEWLFGQAGRPLARAGQQGWAGSGGCVFVSWGSASLSWGRTGNLRWGKQKELPELRDLENDRERETKKKNTPCK